MESESQVKARSHRTLQTTVRFSDLIKSDMEAIEGF